MTVTTLDDMLNDKADREFNAVVHEMFNNIEKLFEGTDKLHKQFSNGRSNYEELQTFRAHVFATLRDHRRQSFKRAFLARHEKLVQEIESIRGEYYLPDE